VVREQFLEVGSRGEIVLFIVERGVKPDYLDTGWFFLVVGVCVLWNSSVEPNESRILAVEEDSSTPTKGATWICLG
jgi:hypothetical protein